MSSKIFWATLISRIFGMTTFLPLYPVVLVWQGQLTSGLKFPLFLVTALFLAIIPLSYFIYCLEKGLVVDIDATKRSERTRPYTVAFLSWTVGILVIKLYGTDFFWRLNFSFYLLITLVVFITFFYKISVHATINSAYFVFLNFLFNWRLWWLFPIILLVCWSRWVLKKHSWHQLLNGVLLGGVVFSLFLQLMLK